MFYAEFSPDGINWDTSLPYVYTTDKTNPPHSLIKSSRYFRIRFTNNSGQNQTYLRIHTYYGVFNQLSINNESTMPINYDSISTRPTNFSLEIAEGLREGVSDGSSFGYNTINNSSETVWVAGGTWQPLFSGETMDVVSSSANDTSAGTGARTILIIGVDASGESASEIITMNGTTTVVTTTLFKGINKVNVLTVGSLTYNAGNITINATTSLTTQSYVAAEDSISNQLIYTLPNDTDAYLTTGIYEANVDGGIFGSDVVTINAYVITSSGVRLNVFQTVLTDNNSRINDKFAIPIKVDAGSRWYIQATTSDADNIFVRGRVEQYLIKNDI